MYKMPPICPPIHAGALSARVSGASILSKASAAAAFAEFEKDIIRQRTLDGLARARSQGKRLGRPHGNKDQKKRGSRGYLLRYAK